MKRDAVAIEDAAPARAPQTPRPAAAVELGTLLALAEGGALALVAFDGQPAAATARTVVDLAGGDIGGAVVVVFEGGDPGRPIVIGRLRGGAAIGPEFGGVVRVEGDGRRMEVVARDKLVLRCGRASITLTRAGKVVIEGDYVLSRSSGVNRIDGGSIQLN